MTNSSMNVTISGNEDWSLMCLTFHSIITLFMLMKYKDYIFLLTTIWLYTGVMLNLTDNYIIVDKYFPLEATSNIIIQYCGYSIFLI